MMITIAIVNQKGGVGKTTTALMVSSGLARAGYKNLLLDGDSQGNIADCLGLERGNDLSNLLFQEHKTPKEKIGISTGISGLDVIRSDKSTSLLKLQLAGLEFREYFLKDSLLDCDYDFAVIDCAPSLDIIFTNAMIAADYILIPTKPSQLSSKGLKDTLDSLNQLHMKLGPQNELLGILPTFIDRSTSESAIQLEHLASSFGHLVFPPIPVDTKVREANRFQKTLWDAFPNTRAVVGVELNGRRLGGYQQVVDRIIKEIG